MQTNVSDNFKINERIVKLVEYLHITKGKFASEIGISTSRLANVTTNRNRPDSELLQLILKRYRNVSADWLILGIGDIEKNITTVTDTDAKYKKECKDCIEKDKLIETLKNINDTLVTQISEASKDKEMYRNLINNLNPGSINKQAS